MKKLFFVLAAAAMIFVSCSKKKDNNSTPAPTPDGYLITRSKVSDDGSTNATYIWENNELVKIDTDGILVSEYETSDAPAQAIFNRVGYDSEISELCSQGCFGKLPNHMPGR